ncbi:ribonuclease HIII [Cytobacillus gottheilii]|uniref:ribonuclease HIII n=1 Tax=Cytobacillus gottheilii TaxID=859144 RepID=UPI0024953559|nr:ribonuclease HIII [Cytobacillus gottheilii]
MSHVVLLKSLPEIKEMQAHYEPFSTGKIPPGGVFAAKANNCSITAYKSGKVLFQGAGAESESARWGGDIAKPKAKKESKPAAANLPENISSLSCIGSDEVGTGDFFGPITVVAAYVSQPNLPLLKELGVRDSKNLNDEKIISIAKQIKEVIPYSLLTLHNDKYNKLQMSGMSQGKIKALLHNQAIGHLLEKIAPEQPEVILIDQFAQKDVYYQYLKSQPKVHRDRVYFSTKAESVHLAVAAASILARYAFVKQFDKLAKEAGFPLTKGAGGKVDEAGARLIHEKGIDALPQFVKLHFANTEKSKKLYRKKYM